jgi:membrane protein DedA with SNARE-associated domain/rhodanese-related sulfurtransferase
MVEDESSELTAMQHIVSEAERYGLLIIFLNVLLAQGGVPLPAFPVLMTAGALLTPGPYQVIQVLAAGVSASLTADVAWYYCGKRYGTRVLRLLCRMSLSPDVCVRQTEKMFLKAGPWSLLAAKLFPALSTISVAMAGITKMPLLAFLPINATGALVIVSVPVGLGRIFRDAVTDILRALSEIGKFGALLVLAAVALYLLTRWWRRQAFIRQLSLDRITVDELRGLIDAGRTPLIVDVRPEGVRAREGLIPGALAANPDDIGTLVMKYPHDSEIVVYCACPNEASAAVAARFLKQAGFKKIRPLLGGIDAWIAAGQPLERAVLSGSMGRA